MATKKEVQEQLARRKLEKLRLVIRTREDVSPAATGALTAGEGFLNNLMAIPSAIGKAPSFLAAGVQGLTGSHGDPGIFGGGDFDFSRRLEKQDRPFLAEAAFNIPRLEVSDIAGASRAAFKNPATGGQFGDLFREEKAGFEEEMAGFREANPKSAFAGDIAGDVATLVTGRAPMASSIRDFEMRLMTSKIVPKITDSATQKVVKDILNSDGMRTLAKGAGRTLETGFEAASLDILHGDDPLETAVYAMAGQATGSGLLFAGQHALKGGFGAAALNIGAASFAAGSLWQIIKDMTPGGRDSIIESIEVGYEKVMLSLVLGAMAGLTGGGRIRGDSVFAKEMPKIADAITAIPRGSVISLLENMVNAEPEQQRNVETALKRLSEAPGKLSKELSDRLQKSFDDGTMVETVDELQKKNEEFRDWLNE